MIKFQRLSGKRRDHGLEESGCHGQKASQQDEDEGSGCRTTVCQEHLDAVRDDLAHHGGRKEDDGGLHQQCRLLHRQCWRHQLQRCSGDIFLCCFKDTQLGCCHYTYMKVCNLGRFDEWPMCIGRSAISHHVVSVQELDLASRDVMGAHQQPCLLLFPLPHPCVHFGDAKAERMLRGA